MLLPILKFDNIIITIIIACVHSLTHPQPNHYSLLQIT